MEPLDEVMRESDSSYPDTAAQNAVNQQACNTNSTSTASQQNQFGPHGELLIHRISGNRSTVRNVILLAGPASVILKGKSA